MKAILSIDPIKFPLTGIGRYTYELAKGLQQENLADLQFLRGLRLQKNVNVPISGQAMAKASSWKLWAQKNKLVVSLYQNIYPWLKAQRLKKFEDYIFHSPNYYLPPFGGRSVVTIHDLSVYKQPKSHVPARVRYMRAEIEFSLRYASVILTDSEYTRKEIVDFFSWPLEKIYAVPLASGTEFKEHSFEAITAAIDSFQLVTDGYTLFVGTIEPRKNLLVLLQAYGCLSLELRRRWPLVIIGYTGWGGEEIHLQIQKAQKEGWVRYLGYVPAEILPFFMAGARLFVYPSLYEGFGLPVLEAMASGVPVVCSNATSLPEVTGDAAALHDPFDVDMLLFLLKQGLEDGQWRLAAKIKGLAQAKKFSWNLCTQQTLNVYRAAMDM